MIAGHPGLGKSQTAVYIAAAVSNGGAWPDDGNAEMGNVVILSAEDGAEDTIVPRLMAAGADLNHVFVIDAVQIEHDGKQVRRTFNLGADLAKLEGMTADIGGASLIIIDPISSYMGGKVDSYNNTKVRAVLEPVCKLAERLKAAVVAVTHFSKAAGGKTILRFLDSIGFIAAARAGWAVVEEAGEDNKPTGRNLFLRAKGNLSADPGGLAYRVESALVPKNIKGDQPSLSIETSRIVWDGAVSVTADEAMAEPSGSKGMDGPLEEAAGFLIEMLSANPRLVTELKKEAADAGHSWVTVKRAKGKLGIMSKKEGFEAGWHWELPGQAIAASLLSAEGDHKTRRVSP